MESVSVVHPSSPSRFVSLAATCLLAVAVVTAGVPGSVVASESAVSAEPTTCRTGPIDTASETVTADRSPHAPPSPIPNESRDTTVPRGDLAVVPLSVPAGSNVTVTVGAASNYTAELRVGDDGDGTVRLVINTYLAGNGSAVEPDAYVVAGNDTVSILGGNAITPFTPGNYSVTVEQNETVVDNRSLTVTEPAVGTVNLKRAAPQLFDAENASVLRTAEDSSLVRPLAPGEYAPEVVTGETLLLRIDAPSLLGLLAAQSGTTPTEQFLQLHDDEPRADVTTEIFGPCGGIRLDETIETGGGRVVVDHRNGSVYLLLDSDNLDGLDAGGQTFYLTGNSDTPIGRAVGEIEREFTIESDELVVERDPWIDFSASENATVSGTTEMLPGSEITIHLSSRVNSTFDRTVTATVDPDGRFTATVDLSPVSTPNSFLVRVDRQSVQGRIGNLAWIHWALSGPGQGDYRQVSVGEFGLDGGFLVVYELNETGIYGGVGVLDGEGDNIEVEDDENASRFFVVAHRDRNDNGEFDGIETDPPYTVGNSAGGQATFFADWLASTRPYLDAPADPPPFDPEKVSMPRWMQEENDTPTETATETPTETPTESESPTPTTTTPPPTGATPSGTAPSPTATTVTMQTTPTTGQSPDDRSPDQTTTGTTGFGAAVALAALLAAVTVLAVRREN